MALTFRQKLGLIPAAVGVMCVGVLAVGAVVQSRGQQMFETVRDQDLPLLETCHQLEEILDRFHRALQDGVAAEDRDALEAARTHAETFARRIGDAGRLAPDDPRVTSVADRFEKYRDLALATSARLLESRDPSQLFAQVKEMARQHQAIRDAVRALTARRSEATKSSFGAALALQRRSTLVFAVMMVACSALLSISVGRIGGDVAARVDALSRSAARIASEGDLTQPIDVSAADEIGELARSFAAMVERLRTIPVTLSATVRELGDAAETLHGCTREQLSALHEQERNMLALSAASSTVLLSGHEASGTARAALQTTTGTARAAGKGSETVKENFEALSSLHAEAEAALETVSAFVERVERAEGVAAAIRALSAQATKLAFEVAASGSGRTDAGQLPRVAAQMQDVATRTSAELARMRDITADLGRVARSVSSRLEESLRSSSLGLERGRAIETYLREVGAMVDQSNAAARSVLRNVDSQRESLEKLNEGIGEVRDLVRTCTSSVQRTTASAAMVRTTADRIARIVQGFRV